MTKLSDSAKSAIDRMGREELLLEEAKGRASRFQGENFAYLKSKLQALELEDAAARHAQSTASAEQSNSIAAEGNQIAREANDYSRRALRIAILSAVISLVAIVTALLKT